MKANDLYSQFTGTEDWHRHFTGLLFTDGVTTLCEELKCWWWLDIVCSYQGEKAFQGEEFQTWDLSVKDGKGKVKATDGNGNTLATQSIPYTDFPHDEVTFWVSHGVVLLPSEY